MNKFKILITIIIFLVCLAIFSISYASEDIRAVLAIDTNLEDAIFGKEGIHISGWKLATEPDTKIVVSIEGQEVENEYITYSYKYDLISIVKGYGTYTENPLPMYDINLPTKNISDGKYNLKIEFKTKNGTILDSVEKMITIQKVKHILTIDTNLDNAVFNKTGIHISGWKLATEPDTRLKVLIDGTEVDSSYIKYSYKYDLISIVKGYGTYEENPLPMYDIDIPTTNIKDGKHNIKIQYIMADGTVLEEVTKIITINKSVKHVLTIDTNLDNAVFNKTGIHISGWKLATEPDTRLKVLIDGTEVDSSYIKYSYKYDLISIVKGYGTYEENPLPMYDIDIPTTNIKDGKHDLNIQFVTKDGILLECIEKTIKVEKVKYVLAIDTNLENATFDKYGIRISGWKLATEPDTRLKVFVDGTEVDSSYIKYSYKYDLISIVKGYGTYTENPKPNFDIDIPVDNITHGSHIITIELVSPDGLVLQKQQNTINIDKSIKSILNIDTVLEGQTFGKSGIHIEGWKLATEADTKLQVYINNQKMDDDYIKYSYKYDLISIVKGYGTYVENPKPNFDINIPKDTLKDGIYSLKIEYTNSDGSIILEKVETTICVKTEYKGIDVSLYQRKY